MNKNLIKKISKNVLLLLIVISILATICTTLFIIKQQNNEIKYYQDRVFLMNELINILEIQHTLDSLEIGRYKELIESIKDSQHTFYVTVTMYNATPYQTDNTPLITADNTYLGNRIDTLDYIAISRDLHIRYGGPFQFGDAVLLLNAQHKIGIYIIKDLMNKRYKRTVDILEPAHQKPYKFRNAFIISLENMKNYQNYTSLFKVKDKNAG